LKTDLNNSGNLNASLKISGQAKISTKSASRSKPSHDMRESPIVSQASKGKVHAVRKPSSNNSILSKEKLMVD